MHSWPGRPFTLRRRRCDAVLTSARGNSLRAGTTLINCSSLFAGVFPGMGCALAVCFRYRRAQREVARAPFMSSISEPRRPLTSGRKEAHAPRTVASMKGALAAATPVIDRAIVDGVDLIVINRFGRAESLGSGLLACFSSALSAGVPVLTAVRAPYDVAWTTFHGGLGLELPDNDTAVVSWARSVSARLDLPPAERRAPL